MDKSKWPKTDKLSEIDIFKLEESKEKASGLVSSYCSPDIELTEGHLSDPAEIWETWRKHRRIQGGGIEIFLYK